MELNIQKIIRGLEELKNDENLNLPLNKKVTIDKAIELLGSLSKVRNNNNYALLIQLGQLLFEIFNSHG